MMKHAVDHDNEYDEAQFSPVTVYLCSPFKAQLLKLLHYAINLPLLRLTCHFQFLTFGHSGSQG